jgi:hypothetical protein
MLKTRAVFLKRTLAVSTLSLVFIFGSACADEMIPVTGSNLNPSALPLLYTMTSMANTVEVLGQTVTAYAATLTPSPVPTKIPDENELKKLISETIKNQLVATLGAKITVVDVKFGPVGAQEYSSLYVEMNCISDNNGTCPSTQAIIAVVDSCKEKGFEEHSVYYAGIDHHDLRPRTFNTSCGSRLV